MMIAHVSPENTAWLYVKLIGTNDIEADVPFVIDTGFSGQLALPRTWIDALSLPEVGYSNVIVADGRQVMVTLHDVKVIWDGQERNVSVHCMEGDALVGMALMADYLLHLPVRANSVVTLSPLL